MCVCVCVWDFVHLDISWGGGGLCPRGGLCPGGGGGGNLAGEYFVLHPHLMLISKWKSLSGGQHTIFFQFLTLAFSSMANDCVMELFFR